MAEPTDAERLAEMGKVMVSNWDSLTRTEVSNLFHMVERLTADRDRWKREAQECNRVHQQWVNDAEIRQRERDTLRAQLAEAIALRDKALMGVVDAETERDILRERLAEAERRLRTIDTDGCLGSEKCSFVVAAEQAVDEVRRDLIDDLHDADADLAAAESALAAYQADRAEDIATIERANERAEQAEARAEELARVAAGYRGGARAVLLHTLHHDCHQCAKAWEAIDVWDKRLAASAEEAGR